MPASLPGRGATERDSLSFTTVLEKFARTQNGDKNSPQVIARHIYAAFTFSAEVRVETGKYCYTIYID